MPTAGELLARKLNGNTTITNTDITTATDKFFSNHGIDVQSKISVPLPKERKDTDTVTKFVIERNFSE